MRPTTTLTSAAALALTAVLAPALASAPASATAETCDGRPATVLVPAPPVGEVATAPVTGTPGDDVIVGTEWRDTIDGAGGNDVICGLAGDDTLVGGTGDDRLFGGLDAQDYGPDDGYYGDLLVPGPGDDHVDLGADPQVDHLWFWENPVQVDQVSFHGSDGPVRVDLAAGTATGEGTDTLAVPEPARPLGVIGSPHDDHLAGTSERDVIDAGRGSDHVLGREGSDVIRLDDQGRAGRLAPPAPAATTDADSLDAGDGSDLVWSRLGADSIAGGPGKDRIFSTSPTPGSVIDGGADRDLLTGLVGTTLRGGGGPDEIESEFAPGVRQGLHGGAGRDVVRLRLPRSAFEPGLHIEVHLPRRRIAVDGRRVVRHEAVETLYVAAPRARLTFWGSNRGDTFWTSSRIRQRSFGRGGADRLYGGSFADLLDGGPGRDHLRGNGGRDRCLRGERLASCEVRR